MTGEGVFGSVTTVKVWCLPLAHPAHTLVCTHSPPSPQSTPPHTSHLLNYPFIPPHPTHPHQPLPSPPPSIRYEGLGADGYHSLFKWYQRFESERFSDPYGVRAMLSKASLGLYPAALQWTMAVFDVPETVAVARGHICTAGAASVSRMELLGFYGGSLAYLWLLAVPAGSFVLGVYLWLTVGFLGVHYDEGFSSLRIRDFKGFLRLHISEEGEMDVRGGCVIVCVVLGGGVRWV